MFHTDFLDIIINFLRNIQKNGPEIALQYINSILNSYVQLQLPINTYRRFRSSNDYVLNGYTEAYGISYLSNEFENKKAIDISYNFNILRIMHTYASQILYEEKMRKWLSSLPLYFIFIRKDNICTITNEEKLILLWELMDIT